MDAHKGVTVLDLHYCNYIHSYAGTFIDFCGNYAEISDTSDTECNVVASVLCRCMILVSARNLTKNTRWYALLSYASLHYFSSRLNG